MQKILYQQSLQSCRRGPDNHKNLSTENTYFGFNRLSINGINKGSDQPFEILNCILICNGEIYNYRELYNIVETKPTTESDCEIIIHLYRKYGIEHSVRFLNGCFAFVLYDTTNGNVYVCRDRFGIRPLSYMSLIDVSHPCFVFTSELKQLTVFTKALQPKSLEIKHFSPGHITTYLKNGTGMFVLSNECTYYTTPMYTLGFKHDISLVHAKIRSILKKAVEKRVLNTSDRNICCLLSGGLDSSLITALTSKYIPNVKTFSIGLIGSEDLKYAKQVAEYLGTNHHEVVVSENDFFDAIPEVIKAIESYDTTTVRASVGNYLIAKYIAKNHDDVVVMNGDGSDELTGGYIYFRESPNVYISDVENRRLLKDIHMFDALRSDKCIASNGLESRTPFLDHEFVNYYLSLDPNVRYKNMKIEKQLLRNAFAEVGILPKNIIERGKEAFSDGVSSLHRSWFSIIKEKIEDRRNGFLIDHFKTSDLKEVLDIYKNTKNPPRTLEQLYYRKIFDDLYPNCSHIIPYFWMPRFVDCEDASARLLPNYMKNKI